MHLFTAPGTPIPRTAIDWDALPPEDLQRLWNACAENPLNIVGLGLHVAQAHHNNDCVWPVSYTHLTLPTKRIV